MPSFEVTAEELWASGALVATSDTELGAGAPTVKGTVSALAGTPAAARA
jgi:hypothetical protein